MKRLLLFLILAASAQAALTVTDRGTGSDSGGGSSIVIAPTSGPLAVGSTGCIVISMDNSGGASINTSATSYTDSQGNIWYVRFDTSAGGANSVAEPVILTSILTHTWTTTDSLTITLNNATPQKTWTISEVVPASGKIALPHAMTSTNQTTTAAGTTVAITTIYPCNGDVILGWGMAEWNGSWTASTDTTDGTFSTAQTIGAGAASATGVSVITQYKVANDTATAQYNLTFGATADLRAGYTLFTETDANARTVGSNNTNDTTTVITFTRPMTAGSAAVMCIAADNAQTNGGPGLNLTSATITDTASGGGNTWTKYQDVIYDPAAANAGAEVAYYVAILAHNVAVGDTMTLAWSATTASKCWGVWEFAPAGAGTMSYVASGNGTGAATASPTTTSSSIASGDYIVGLVGIENTATTNDNIVADSDTSNGTWSTQLSVTRGTGLTGMAMSTQWKKVTAAATQTYNPTISAGTPDTMIAWLQINDSSVLGPTAAQKGAFFLLFP